MKNRFRQVLASREAGFSLESILIGVGLMALLAAIAIPTFLSQRNKAFDAAVRSDLRTAATAAQTYYVDAFVYAEDATTFASDGDVPAASPGTQYAAYVSNVAGANGYVIYGLSRSGTVFELSSWNNNVPEEMPDGTSFSSLDPDTAAGVPTGANLSTTAITWDETGATP